MSDCASFSLGCRLPSTASAKGFPSLFGCFTGTTQQSDSSIAYTSAVRLCAFADRSAFSADALEVSRFSCMLFLDVPGSYHAESRSDSQFCRLNGYCLPIKQTRSARGSSVIGAQSPGPPMPLSTLRRTPRDAPRKTRGQNRLAAPFSVGLFHPLQHAGLSRRLLHCTHPLRSVGFHRLHHYYGVFRPLAALSYSRPCGSCHL
jgi:hypothetical protein